MDVPAIGGHLHPFALKAGQCMALGSRSSVFSSWIVILFSLVDLITLSTTPLVELDLGAVLSDLIAL